MPKKDIQEARKYAREKYYVIRENPTFWFKRYRSNARNHGFTFGITLKQFTAFWRKSCFYCGDKIERIGLDRIDSSLGYLKSNIVPCCYVCNWMKRHLSVNVFLNHCKKIIKNQPPTNS